MKFVTFNIRYDTPHDGANCFAGRAPLIQRTLEAEKPDVVCFQEVLPHVQTWLRKHLMDYYVIGCGREEDLDGERVSIAFRQDRYNLISLETYWLSETPYEPATVYPDQSICPRVCAEALLLDEETGKAFRVVNVHLDHVGAQSRALALKQIMKHLEEVKLCPDAPVILAGDFNAEPDSMELEALRASADYTNATEGIGLTFHAYGLEKPQYIDYIWLKGDVACERVQKWEHEEQGIYLSDHYPVCAELSWK